MLPRLFASLLLLLAFALPASATPSFPAPDTVKPWNAVVTYHSIGLYWKPSGATGGKATVRFRKQNTTAWREGHELWWDDRNDEFRGSLVELDHNSIYEIQLKVGTGTWTDTTASCSNASETNCVIPATSSCSGANRTQCTRTWNNNYLTKEVRTVTSRNSTLVITDGGNETEGYIVYEGEDGSNTISQAVETGGDAHVDVTNDTFTIPSTPGKWTTGMAVSLRVSSGSITGPNYASDSRLFYLIVVNPTTVKLATTEANALAGSAINITGKSNPVWEIGGACIIVDAKFVAVRNLVLDGCSHHAIHLYSKHSGTQRRAASDVIIEDNEIRGWGRWRQRPVIPNPLLAEDGDAAVHCNNTAETANGDLGNRSHRIVIQRNKIHSPRHTSEPWYLSENVKVPHPWGAMAGNFIYCGSNHVVRWNDVYSAPNAEQEIKYFKDGFGGAPDFVDPNEDPNVGGFPWADSDIYGNRISHAYDDAIESEGFNRNVRIWANYVDRVQTAFATAANVMGPLYIWRNVTHWMGDMGCPTCDPDTTFRRHGMIKGGGELDTGYHGGIAYYYHNTLLQPPGNGTDHPMGAARPIATIGQLFYNFVSRNNILHSHKPDGFRTIDADCSMSATACTPVTPDDGPAMNFDLYNGRLQDVTADSETDSMTLGWAGATHGTGNPLAVPTYLNPGAVSWYPAVIPSDSNGWKGDFRLAANSKGISTLMTALPNFNDQDSARHAGAQPPNKTEMKFGRAAAPDDPVEPPGAPVFRGASTATLATGTIAFRAATSAATNTTSLTVNVPTGTAANDVMVASIGVRPHTATVTPPAGWTALPRVDNSGGVSLAVFYKVAATGEPASHTWTLSGQNYAAGGIKSFSGVHTTTPIDVQSGQATPVSLSHATPSVTTTVANAMVVTAHTFATSTTWTPPAGMTEGFDIEFQPVPVNQGVSTEGSYVAQAAAGATGAKTANAAPTGTSGAEGWGATHILALRPAAPGLAITKPTGTVQNDVMIAAIGVRPHTATITPPSGWVALPRINNTGGISLAVFRKTAGAAEPGSYAWSIGGANYAVGGVQSFSNADPANPVVVESGLTTPVSLDHATPSVNTAVANTMVVTAHTYATSTTWTPPSGMSEGFDVQVLPVPAGMGQALEGSYAVQAAAGATGAKTAHANGVSGDEGWGATHILVLRPAP